MTYEAVNPAPGEVVERYPTAGDQQVQEAMRLVFLPEICIGCIVNLLVKEVGKRSWKI